MKYLYLFADFVLFLCDVIVPRFVTEQVAIIDEDDGFRVLCRAEELEPGEQYDGFVTLRSFNLFGYGLFPKVVD